MTAALSVPRARTVSAALARRNLAERSRLVVGLAVAGLALAAMTASLYSSMGDAYGDMFEGLPPAVVRMFGDADFSTAEGFLQIELFTFVAPGLAIGAAIAVAAGAIAGAEQRGWLALVVSSPIRRSCVVEGAIVAMLVAVAAVAVGVMAGVLVGGSIGETGVGVGRILAACISLGLLAVAVGMVALAAGAATGRRGVAVGAGIGVALISYAVDAFFPLNTTLEPFAKCSLWFPYAGNDPLVNGLDPWHVLSLVAVASLAAAVAFAAFERRDLRT